MNEPILRLENLSKDFGDGFVLNNFNLDVFPGEFLTLLGPSGCGKTTTLRIIAGLETPTGGSVFLEGVNVTNKPPEKRQLNTVFQNYALFPHMNVYQNIAYGLKLQKVSRAEQHERVKEALALVRLSGYEKRMPSQLSGGQKQRVAIARAVVLKPKILLLDEPLGALDLKLRQEMQKELKLLQRQLGITFIYITHDQEEALNMSTRIVVMRNGHIEQIGTPEEIYEHPQTFFAAEFIGQSNLLKGTVCEASDGSARILVSGCQLPAQIPAGMDLPVGAPCALCLRPQRISYGMQPQHGMELFGVIQSKEYVGGMQHVQIAVNDSLTLNAVNHAAELDAYPIGCKVYVGWPLNRAPVVPYPQESQV